MGAALETFASFLRRTLAGMRPKQWGIFSPSCNKIPHDRESHLTILCIVCVRKQVMVSMLLSRRIFVYNSHGGNYGLSQMVYTTIGHDNGLPWNQNYPEGLSKGGNQYRHADHHLLPRNTARRSPTSVCGCRPDDHRRARGIARYANG